MPFDVTERLCPSYFLPFRTAFLPEYFSVLFSRNPMPQVVINLPTQNSPFQNIEILIVGKAILNILGI